jgi:hypothetical protein
MSRINLVPAYGRDYKSKKEIIADLIADKDFTIADMSNPFDGRYINLSQIRETPYKNFQVRYGKLRKITTITLAEIDKAAEAKKESA